MAEMMRDLFEEDAEQTPDSADFKLGKLGELANEQIQLELAIQEQEKQLAELNKRYQEVSERQIPDLMQQLGGMQKLVVRGWTIQVKPFYAASISEEHKAAAFAWLAEHKHDDLIKNDVYAKFGKGEDDKAESLIEEIRKLGYSVEQKKYVHPQTLKAFVKEQIERGVDFPQETFGVYTGYKTTVKRG